MYKIKQIAQKLGAGISIKVLLMGVLMLILANTEAGENLIKNSDFNKAIHPVCHLDNTPEGHAKLLQITEDLTWNKCSKMEIANIRKVNDLEIVDASVVFYEGNLGFPVKPNTTYKYSLELKGVCHGEVYIYAMGWTGTDRWKGRHKIKNGLTIKKVPAEWEAFKGTFKTQAEDKSATLVVQMWWNTKYGPMKYKIGDYILIDNVVIEEVQDPISALKKKPSPIKDKIIRFAIADALSGEISLDGKLNEAEWKNSAENSAFIGLRNQDKATEASHFVVLTGKDALYIGIQNDEPEMAKIKADISDNGSKIWQDDIVEIFLGSPAMNQKFIQLAVSAGGGRYIGDGNSELPALYDKWSSKTSCNKASWSVELKVPYSLLGWNTAPKSGDSIPFNIARQRMPVKNLSTWSKLDNSFHDINNFGRLIINSQKDFIKKETDKVILEANKLRNGKDKQALLEGLKAVSSLSDPQKAVERLKACQVWIRNIKLGSRKFVVTTVSPTISPEVPMIPDELNSLPEKISVRTAINDLKSVPFTITNLTDKLEEYRVVLLPGGDYKMEKPGLAGGNGIKFPAEKIKILRGVRVKDRDGAKPIQRFDPLVELDDSGSIASAPNDSALLWLQLDCQGIKPGKYTGVLRIIPLSEPAKIVSGTGINSKGGFIYQGEMLDLPFEIEVLPFEISANTVKPWDLMYTVPNERYFKKMLDQGVRMFICSPYHFLPKFNKDGSINGTAFDSKLETNINSYLQLAKKYGVEKEIKFGLSFSSYLIVKKYTMQNFKFGSPEWTSAWKNYVRSLAEIFKRNGVSLDRVYVELIDEPELQLQKKIIAFDELIEVHRLFKETEPNMHTFAWLDCHTPAEGYKGKLMPYLDAWGFYSTLLLNPQYQPLIQKLRKNGKKIWTYRCNTAVNSDLYTYYRQHAWIAYHCNVDLIGFFIAVDPVASTWSPFSWKLAPPYGAIFYRSGDKIISSIRSECLKLGNQDIKYLEKLKRLIAEEKNNGSDVKQAEDFLKAATEQVVITKYYDCNKAEQVRNEAIDLILSLKNNTVNKN
jgi:hypothetical protein